MQMQLDREERPLKELFSELASESAALIRDEVRLAKLELGQKAAQAGKHMTLVAIGGAVAYAGLLAVIAGMIVLVGSYIPMWLSALILGVAVIGIGYATLQSGLSALKRLDPTPRATLETLRLDKEWAKEQMR
jgi:hypothetical protein